MLFSLISVFVFVRVSSRICHIEVAHFCEENLGLVEEFYIIEVLLFLIYLILSHYRGGCPKLSVIQLLLL